ncbi:hypothetical protein [Cupriavidus sp. DL-D2]|jgi:hypothetical protein|uniref:hypothetical protein n=1 Tax=Cupriavidus sp. DL-D2 TaxID=3144974 RepID=UPI0032140D18
MNVHNGWKQWKYFDAETEVEGEVIDVERYVTVLEKAGGTEAYFHRDGITPCIDIVVASLVTPRMAIQVGAALERACGYPIRMLSLKPHAMEFAVEGRFLLPDSMEYQVGHFSNYGERISTLASAWSIDQQ